VHVWFKDVCRDVVNEFAPWANDFIDYRPIYDAISCGTSEGTGLSLHDHDVGSMNHWVVAIAFEVQDISTVDRTREGGTESEELFFGLYLSLHRLVVKTIADGDCGLDAMCLMLGVPRTLASRRTIRHDCSKFARTNVGNRALIAMLHTTGEMHENLGLYELLPSGVSLMTSLLEEPAPAIHHGDGVCVPVPTDIAPPPARDYSPEEVSALCVEMSYETVTYGEVPSGAAAAS